MGCAAAFTMFDCWIDRSSISVRGDNELGGELDLTEWVEK